jgi:hypothetical protein
MAVRGGFARRDPAVGHLVLVFAVAPAKVFVFAFGKGPFSQTRYRAKLTSRQLRVVTPPRRAVRP